MNLTNMPNKYSNKVFIDSLDNISIVNLNVPSLSADDIMTDNSSEYESGLSYDILTPRNNTCNASILLSDHLDDDPIHESTFPFDLEADSHDLESSYRTHHRRTTSSLEKVRTWKKYKNKKHLTQTELDRKRDLANKQERRRMHRLNDALNRLRQVISKQIILSLNK